MSGLCSERSAPALGLRAVCLFEFCGGCALVLGVRSVCLLGFEGSDRGCV